ncbi:MAG: TRAP transporter large permease [Desulfobacterales bacterium]|nr:TRAP transporter large permease [Desulfobacterales bacterium]
MIYLVLIFFVFCLAMGMPIVFALGVPGVLYILLSGVPANMIPAKLIAGVDVFVLLAIPMFIVAGNLMNEAGISRRLVRFSIALVGAMPGGLAMVNVVASMFFSGVTGAASADTAAMGSILIPAMKKQGYEDGFTAAITAVSSTIGPIIPPSILFVVYGYIANVSIARLFLGGVIPGILIGFFLMATVFILAKKKGYPAGDRFSLSRLWEEFKGAFLALLLPLIILLGIGMGIMTPTEVSGVAVVMAFVVGKFVYKELTMKALPRILFDSAVLSGAVVFIVATNNILLYAVTLEQIADKIGAFLFSITTSKIVILLILNVMLLILGAVVDCLPLMIMFIPIVKPLFASLGIDPVHAGVFMVLNMTIGLSTPPVGTSLFIAASITKTDIQTAGRAMMPFLAACILVLLLVTYFPVITLWIPGMVMN